MSLAAVLIGFLSIMVPGFFLALGLLKKTKLNIFEIAAIGFIFGLIFPPTMVWVEGYFINSIHAFTFSAGLYNTNVVILTIIGIVLSFWQGAFDLTGIKIPSSKKEAGALEEIRSDYKERISHLRGQLSNINVDMAIVKAHEKEEELLIKKHEEELRLLREKGAGAEELQRVGEAHRSEERNLVAEHEREERRLISGEKPKETKTTQYAVWSILLILMLITFASRVINLNVAPRYFEFDPYFDMMSTAQILTWGYQLKIDHSAWPVYLNGTLIQQGNNATNGTIHRIQPIVPYLEAYWYDIANPIPTASQINTNLLSTVSSVYSPLVAALLVFVVFMFIYHEYGSFPALIAAALATTMPTLITTFIAGEQLVEPWGIFALFFMVAAYGLAAKYPEQKRYAILAGIAFAANFLGAHYYNVTAAVLTVYIIVQGLIDTVRNKNHIDFYKMNAIMLLVIILFYAVYAPYNATLTNRVPSLLGIPTIVAFPLFALIFVIICAFLTDTLAFEFIPSKIASIPGKLVSYFEKNEAATLIISAITIFGLIPIAVDALSGSIHKHLKAYSRFAVIAILLYIMLAMILFTPLGKPINDYITLAEHFTTPSTPLFMTVQEYVVTGPLFNFGSAGLGTIAASVAGFPLMVWLVLVLFAVFTSYAIYKGSRSSIFSFVMLVVLAVGAMSEVKYLPHFGVAFIIAIGLILGEVYMMIKARHAKSDKTLVYAIYAIGIIAVLVESGPLLSVFTASGMTCSQISNSNLVVAATLYCNVVTPQWLSATAWMRANVGPFAPRILSWWDYGDWINWFGNSNAVIRGDNAVATLDYAVAAHFVLGSKDGYNASVLGGFMDKTQAKYVLFDDQLVPKWSALDFLACVDVNQTSKAYAISQGKQYGTPFLLGTSPCELAHDPVIIAIPEQPNINEYCQFSNSTQAISAITFVGETIPSPLNVTYCVSTTQNKQGVLNVYNANGTKTNIVLSTYYYLGAIAGPNSQTYVEFLAIYLPNGPNGTITNAPTEFYNSTYYQGFFFGKLPGFTLVYPKNFSGINMVNSTNTVMILAENNYTGALPYVTPKPSWVKNNYTIPG